MLIERCKLGDSNAMTALYQQTWKKVYPSVLFLLKNKEEAEDIMQEGFIKGFQRLHELQDAEKFVPWLKSICMRKGLDHLRKKNIFHSGEFNEERFEHLPYEEDTPYKVEWNKNLLETLNRMPRGFQVVIQLHAFEGMTHLDIADKLGISPSTARSQYARAIQKLRKEMINE